MTTLPALQIPPALSTDWLSTVPMAATGQPLSSDSLSSVQTNGKHVFGAYPLSSIIIIVFIMIVRYSSCRPD